MNGGESERPYPLPNLHTLNVIIVGLLGGGAFSTRMDCQAKSLGEYLHAKIVDLPDMLLADAPMSVRAAETG